MKHEAVIIERDYLACEGVWLLRLNHPESSNALSYEVIDALVTALKLADSDNSCRVVMMTGEGKSFCAGGDVKAMKNRSGMFAGEAFELKRLYENGIQLIPKTIEAFTKPLIALVNGAAIGAGCDLACMADIRLASEDARFGETFARLGLVPGDGGAFFLSRIVGYSRAMEMFLSAKIYSSSEALEMGLVSRVVPGDELLIAGAELAKTIAANAPVAVALVKRALKESRMHSLETHLDLISTYQALAQRTQDHFEGVDALLEKRTPKFQGK